MPPPVEWIAASVPKAGNRAEENEDASAADPASLRFAVSDGASEGWESGEWAARVARAYVERPPAPSDFARWLAGFREAWSPQPLPESAPWYASLKRDQGSFATLVGIEFRRRVASKWAWRAVAVGDSCLFHVRGGEVKSSFPLASPGAFGNRPALIASRASPGPAPEWRVGRAAPGDLFVMATDAAAARLLTPEPLSAALPAIAAALRSRDAATLLDWCRGVQGVVNDDVSVVAIRLPAEEGA